MAPKNQNKLCCIPFEQMVTMGLTKVVVVQYFIVQNYKNSNTSIFIYKGLYLIMFLIFACLFISMSVAYTKIYINNYCLE
jgi:hypothetical protein